MFSARPLVILFYLTLVVLASALSSSINATIDHDDPSVTYSEGWEQVVVDEDSSSCTHMLSSHNPSAYALVKFRGTAFYVVSPKWPYRVAATISIDEGQPVHIDLQDHDIESEGQGPTTPANVVAHQGGLDPNTEHTLRIFTQPGEPFLVFHSLIYTSTADDSTPASASPSSATGPTSEPEAAAGISSPMAMTLGVAIGVGGSVILALSLLLLQKRRRSRPRLAAFTESSDVFHSAPPSPKAFSFDQPLSSPWELPTFVRHPPPSRTNTPRLPSFSVRVEPLPSSFATVNCTTWDKQKLTEEPPASEQIIDPRKLQLDIPPAYRTRFSSGPEGMCSPVRSPAPRYSTLPCARNRPPSTAKLVLTCERRTNMVNF